MKARKLFRIISIDCEDVIWDLGANRTDLRGRHDGAVVRIELAWACYPDVMGSTTEKRGQEIIEIYLVIRAQPWRRPILMNGGQFLSCRNPKAASSQYRIALLLKLCFTELKLQD